MEYSLVDTPVTVCVSRIFASLLLFLAWSSDLWYVKVKGGSPVRVKTISAWSPVNLLKHHGSWAMYDDEAYPRGCPVTPSSHFLPSRKVEDEQCNEDPSRQSCTLCVDEPQR